MAKNCVVFELVGNKIVYEVKDLDILKLSEELKVENWELLSPGKVLVYMNKEVTTSFKTRKTSYFGNAICLVKGNVKMESDDSQVLRPNYTVLDKDFSEVEILSAVKLFTTMILNKPKLSVVPLKSFDRFKKESSNSLGIDLKLTSRFAKNSLTK